MSLTEKTSVPVPYSLEKSTFQPRKMKRVDIQDNIQNPMIGIYLVKEGRFSYFNDGLKKLLGENSNKLLDEGWDFWFSLLDHKNVAYIKNQITHFFSCPYVQNLLTLNYRINDVRGKCIPMKHEIIIHQFDHHLVAINFFLRVLEKEKKDYFFEAKSTVKSYHSQEREELRLSPREKEVLHLIGDGFSSKQIADMLFISDHTAISHRKNLIEKFHVKNTAHLIKKASELIPSF